MGGKRRAPKHPEQRATLRAYIVAHPASLETAIAAAGRKDAAQTSAWIDAAGSLLAEGWLPGSRARVTEGLAFLRERERRLRAAVDAFRD